MRSGKIRVLIVDDQPSVRAFLDRGLSEDPDIEVVGRASDAYAARDKIEKLAPDVVTLDIEMPRMNGLEFLKRLMPQYPLPVIMVSSHTGEGQILTFEALEAGAVDFVCKPGGDAGGFESMMLELREKIRGASRIDKMKLRGGWRRPENVASPSRSRAPIKKRPVSSVSSGIKMIALGASTGGTLAVRELLSQMPTEIPGIVVVQHMPAGFTAMFAQNLNKLTAFEVTEARSGDPILPGTVLIAPGDKHLIVRKDSTHYCAEIVSSEKIQGHRPSVDVLFDSVAEFPGSDSLGILLTGMGADGARGLLRMRANGSRTIGQDEESSVVYGMPRVAYELGAVETQCNLADIPDTIAEFLRPALRASRRTSSGE